MRRFAPRILTLAAAELIINDTPLAGPTAVVADVPEGGLEKPESDVEAVIVDPTSVVPVEHEEATLNEAPIFFPFSSQAFSFSLPCCSLCHILLPLQLLIGRATSYCSFNSLITYSYMVCILVFLISPLHLPPLSPFPPSPSDPFLALLQN